VIGITSYECKIGGSSARLLQKAQKPRHFCLPVSSSLAEIGNIKMCKNIAQVCGVKEQCVSIQLRAKMVVILICSGTQSAAKE